MPVKMQGVRVSWDLDLFYSFRHYLSGSSTLKCKSSGLWNYPEPSCQPYRCPSEEVKDGTISSVGPYLWHDVITYRCNIGFHLTGGNMRECGPTGQWLSGAPSCQPIECTFSSDILEPEESGPYYYGDRVSNHVEKTRHYLLVLECDNHRALSTFWKLWCNLAGVVFSYHLFETTTCNYAVRTCRLIVDLWTVWWYFYRLIWDVRRIPIIWLAGVF